MCVCVFLFSSFSDKRYCLATDVQIKELLRTQGNEAVPYPTLPRTGNYRQLDVGGTTNSVFPGSPRAVSFRYVIRLWVSSFEFSRDDGSLPMSPVTPHWRKIFDKKSKERFFLTEIILPVLILTQRDGKTCCLRSVVALRLRFALFYGPFFVEGFSLNHCNLAQPRLTSSLRLSSAPYTRLFCLYIPASFCHGFFLLLLLFLLLLFLSPLGENSTRRKVCIYKIAASHSTPNPT